LPEVSERASQPAELDAAGPVVPPAGPDEQQGRGVPQVERDVPRMQALQPVERDAQQAGEQALPQVVPASSPGEQAARAWPPAAVQAALLAGQVSPPGERVAQPVEAQAWHCPRVQQASRYWPEAQAVRYWPEQPDAPRSPEQLEPFPAVLAQAQPAWLRERPDARQQAPRASRSVRSDALPV
jgi:hypothetical protein